MRGGTWCLSLGVVLLIGATVLNQFTTRPLRPAPGIALGPDMSPFRDVTYWK